jgi:hypothetical protein
MPKCVTPIAGPALHARVAAARGEAVLRAVLLEVLAEAGERSRASPRIAGDEPHGRAAPAWVGRRPSELVEERPSRRGRPLGQHLARSAHLEASAVEAFRMLGDELAHYGAPRALLRAIESARADEVRHARLLTALARRFGGVFREPRLRARGPRTLLELAVENAVEGCVRETFGALVALRQARAAREPSVASVMHRVAEDEIRHASLAFRVDRWLRTQLPEPRWAEVDAAMRSAFDDLRVEASLEPETELVALAGLPRRAEAVALVDALRARIER